MIKDIAISQIHNSFKEKTIKVFLKTEKGVFSASPPSGKSRGRFESKTLDMKTILKIFPRIKNNFIGENESNVDKIIENVGIENIGANLSIALSIASLRAISNNDVYKFLNFSAKKFPYPLGNVIGEWLKNSIQEFLVIPIKAKTIEEAIKTNFSIWKDVGNILRSRKNYEGACVSKFDDIKNLDLLSKISENYEARIGLDFAASHLYKDGKYIYSKLNKKLDKGEQLDFVIDLIKTYKIFYVEDPFNENDFESFGELTRKAKCLIVGDDIFSTQPDKLEIGVKRKAGNAIIIKPDQAGTVSKTLNTIKIAKKAGFATIVSHRSGETNDNFIADLAIGTESPFIKCGVYGKERKSKLNRLLEIWNEIKNPRMSNIFI